jgi:RES domain-containing protein
MITSFRIVNKKFAQAAFSGDGARQYGGCWNPVRFAAVYTAESRALAVLEILVHLDVKHLKIGASQQFDFDHRLTKSLHSTQ